MTAQGGVVARDEPAVIRFAGELDAADSSWSDELDEVIEAGSSQVVVDLLNVTFADSSVIRQLVLAHRRTSATGWIRVVYTHHVIRRVIEICGLSELLPQFTTVDAALRNAPTQHHTGSEPTS